MKNRKVESSQSMLYLKKFTTVFGSKLDQKVVSAAQDVCSAAKGLAEASRLQSPPEWMKSPMMKKISGNQAFGNSAWRAIGSAKNSQNMSEHVYRVRKKFSVV